jgi:hypothetical protein
MGWGGFRPLAGAQSTLAGTARLARALGGRKIRVSGSCHGEGGQQPFHLRAIATDANDIRGRSRLDLFKFRSALPAPVFEDGHGDPPFQIYRMLVDFAIDGGFLPARGDIRRSRISSAFAGDAARKTA